MHKRAKLHHAEVFDNAALDKAKASVDRKLLFETREPLWIRRWGYMLEAW